MAAIDLEKILLDELGYAPSPGLNMSPTWPNGRSISNVSGSYSIQDVQVAYFSRFEAVDTNEIWQLHRAVWNESRVPLLYVILPQEIRIYNAYDLPTNTPEELDSSDTRLLRRLTDLVNIETARQRIRVELRALQYDRLHLDTGTFWSTEDGQKIHRETRADQHLLRAMDKLRHKLNAASLPSHIAYSLLGRSILIRYLEDRGILDREAVLRLTDGGVQNYRDSLRDLDLAYRLFERLDERFHGDLFPVTKEERDTVNSDHLVWLGKFLDGTDLESGQLSFWPYNFEYVPIQLISEIYDTFLHVGERKAVGAYYTPLALADFVLEETLPTEETTPDTKVIDPACGSGIFLVNTYLRLVHAWETQNRRQATVAQLVELMQKNIFGVDLMHTAVQIAIFNLYLALLDRLDSDVIRNTPFHFPRLENTNLFIGDFFSDAVQEKLAGKKFDRVVGNPPWGKSTSTAECDKWLEARGYSIGERQIAQAFLMAGPELCADNGEVAMIVPAKSTVLITSTSNAAFRRQFFSKYRVRAVYNFAALRHELFAGATHPTVVMYYGPVNADSGHRLVYATPKPSSLSQQIGTVVLDATEVKYISQKEFSRHPELWKAALWGSKRDADLIQRLKRLPTLREQADKLHWKIGPGFQVGGPGKKQPAPWLEGMNFLPAKLFQRYIPDPTSLGSVPSVEFYRASKEKEVFFRAPLVLVRMSPSKGRCSATFSNMDLAYKHTITGIAGHPEDEDLLKWLVAYINSPLATYFHFMTSTRWGVERDSMLQYEYEQMPFVIPSKNDSRLSEILQHFDAIADLLKANSFPKNAVTPESIAKHEDAIAEIVYDIYGLNNAERQLVRDTLNYSINFFYWSIRQRRKPNGTDAVKPPNARMLRQYAETFMNTVAGLLSLKKQSLKSTVYQDGAPLSVIGFQLTDFAGKSDIQVVTSAHTLRDTLERLDTLLLTEKTPSVYTRKHVRIYDGSWLYLVRPSEQRFWTQSQARVDADDAVVEWLNQPLAQGDKIVE